MVTKSQVLEELNLEKLKKIADKLGVHVSKGLYGFISQTVMGPESRRPFIEALNNSNLVTLEEIDRILHTRYSRIPDMSRGGNLTPTAPRTSASFFASNHADTRAGRLFTYESLSQHILHNYVIKSDLQKICQHLGISAVGNKGDVEARILNDLRFASEMALDYVNRGDMKKLCEDLGINSAGTRGEMESRVANVYNGLPRSPPIVPPYEPPRYYQPTPQYNQTLSSAPPSWQAQRPNPTPPTYTQVSTVSTLSQTTQEKQPPLESPKLATPSSLPYTPQPSFVSSVPVSPDLESVFEFIQKWSPSRRFKDEEKYQIELATELRNKFESRNVMTELNVSGGRIDIEVKGIGVELKVPNKSQLQRLIGQANMYQKHYGPNLVVVIFNDIAKFQDINWFCNDLDRLGIRSIVK